MWDGTLGYRFRYILNLIPVYVNRHTECIVESTDYVYQWLLFFINHDCEILKSVSRYFGLVSF